MKWLHREITSSDTYQRSWRANETNRLDERNFSRAVPRRLPAEVAVDAIAQATSGDEKAAKYTTSNEGRAIAIPGAGRRISQNPTYYALTVFGRSIRESNCDCDRSAETSLLQTVFLRNDQQTLAMIDGRDSWLQQVAKEAEIPFSPKTYSRGGNNNGRNKALQRLRQQLGQQYKTLKKLRQNDANEKQIARVQKTIRSLRKKLGMNPQPGQKSETAVADAASSNDKVDHDQLIRDAYLRTLSRVPTDDEKTAALAHLV